MANAATETVHLRSDRQTPMPRWTRGTSKSSIGSASGKPRSGSASSRNIGSSNNCSSAPPMTASNRTPSANNSSNFSSWNGSTNSSNRSSARSNSKNGRDSKSRRGHHRPQSHRRTTTREELLSAVILVVGIYCVARATLILLNQWLDGKEERQTYREPAQFVLVSACTSPAVLTEDWRENGDRSLSA